MFRNDTMDAHVISFITGRTGKPNELVMKYTQLSDANFLFLAFVTSSEIVFTHLVLYAQIVLHTFKNVTLKKMMMTQQS